MKAFITNDESVATNRVDRFAVEREDLRLMLDAVYSVMKQINSLIEGGPISERSKQELFVELEKWRDLRNKWEAQLN